MTVNTFKIEKYRVLTYPAPVVELLHVQPVLAVRLFILSKSQPVMALQMLLHVMNLVMGWSQYKEDCETVTLILALQTMQTTLL